MATTIRVTALAAMIGTCLAGGALVSNVQAAEASEISTARATYLIEFTDAGVLYYQGGVAGLRATAADGTARARKFDASSADAMNYRRYLRDRQAAQIDTLAGVLGHSLEISHRYEITHSGIAVLLTADEAAKLASAPDVKSIQKEQSYTLDTYRGPTFIGADTIWNATLPGGPTNRGKGVVVGVLDSGGNSTHPSFADDASCGFGPTNHKLLSGVDCATSSGGVCNGPNPEADVSSHGVHTASTAAGNVVTNAASPSPNLPAPYNQLSGVAPCASVRTYKVCPGTTCPTAAILAGIANAIIDGVDVINFSISGGRSPWNDNDRKFLDAVNADIVVAASAGNTSQDIPDPVGNVNHLGPWVMTVAASTQDVNLGSGLTTTGPGTPPAATQNLLAIPSSTTVAADFTDLTIRVDNTNLLGCTAFAPGTFTGAVALIQRGTCAFSNKINNAAAAGATNVVIYNNGPGAFIMSTPGVSIPGYMIRQDAGQALNDFITANGATPTTTSLIGSYAGAVPGDVLADFSFRGPTPAPVADLTKPDITGPGVNIYAGASTADGSYMLMSGTSMSGPHLAGSAALIRSVHPDWTPMEVKSALQLTAKIPGVKQDEVTPWDIDDVGNGRVDLNNAAYAGFVMDETFANFVAANPNGGSINIKDLNLPSVRNVGLTAANPNYTWTRVLRNAHFGPSTWNVTVDQPAGVTVSVNPTSFSFTGAGIPDPDVIFGGDYETYTAPPAPETQTITITATTAAATAGIAFGQVKFTEATSQAPEAHITVAVKRQ